MLPGFWVFQGDGWELKNSSGSTSFCPCLCAANHLSLSIFSIRLGYVNILPSHPKFPFLFLCSVLCTPLSRPWCYPSILIVSTLGPLCVYGIVLHWLDLGFSGCLDVRVSSTANIIRFCSPFCCSHLLLCLIPGPQVSGMLDTQRASRVSLVWTGFSSGWSVADTFSSSHQFVAVIFSSIYTCV